MQTQAREAYSTLISIPMWFDLDIHSNVVCLSGEVLEQGQTLLEQVRHGIAEVQVPVGVCVRGCCAS